MRCLCLLLLLVTSANVLAQENTAELLKQYQAERTAVASRFPAEALTKADSLAARATAAQTANDPRAAKYAREARWALPYIPPGLPENISRVYGTGRMRHADRITGVSYLPDGQRLVSSSRDGTAKVWNLANGAELQSYKGHPEVPNAPNSDKPPTDVFRVSGVSVHPKDGTIATSGVDGVHIWNADTGKLIRKLPINTKPTRALAFGPDGTRLVTGSDDNVLRLWDTAKDAPLFATKPLSGRIEGIAFSPKGNMVAAVTIDGKVHVFGIKDDKEKLLLSTNVTSPSGSANGVVFSPEGTGLFTAGDDKVPRLTSGPAADSATALTTAATVRTFNGHIGNVSCLALSPDGNLLVTGGYAANDQTVRAWDTNTGKSLRVYQGHQGHLTAVIIRRDGKEVASGDENGAIRLWPLSANDEHRASAESTDALWAATVSPGGTRLATAGADKTVRIYDTISGKVIHTLTGHSSAITALAFINEDTLASGSGDKLIKVWDIKAGKLVKDLAGHASVVFALSASADGKTLVSGSADKTIKSWDLGTGQAVWTYNSKSSIPAITTSFDGKQIVAGTADGWLMLLEPSGNTVNVKSTIPAHTSGVAAVAFSPKANRLASVGGDGVMKSWTFTNTGTFTIQLVIEAPPTTNPTGTPGPLSAVAINSGDNYIATAGADSVIHVYDIITGKEHRSLRAHLDWVTAIAFTPNGLNLFSASVDKTGRLFELNTSDVGSSGGYSRLTRAIAISPNGKQFATAISDQPVKIWDMATGKELGTLTGAMGELNALAYANDDTILAGEDKGRVVWMSTKTMKEIANATTGKVYTMAPGSTPNTAVVWAVPQDNKDLPPKASSFEILTPGAKPIITEEKKQTISCAAISGDGVWAVAGTPEGKIRFYELATQKPAADDWALFNSYVVDVAITPDRSTIVSVDDTGTVKIGDVKSRTVTKTVKAHEKAPNGILLAKTGKMFVTLGADNEVKAWDLTGKELRSWKLQAGIAAAAITPEGKQILTANNDGTLFVLELP